MTRSKNMKRLKMNVHIYCCTYISLKNVSENEIVIATAHSLTLAILFMAIMRAWEGLKLELNKNQN